MAMDLIVRGANLPDGRTGVDIGVQDGRIVAVEPALKAEAGQEIDATDRLVSPPFIDAHFHMDATLARALTDALPRPDQSGLLFEGIYLWDELKRQLTPEAVAERALTYCDMALAQGIQAIRSHVDVCDDRLTGVEALLEVKRRVAPYIDLQLIAFPQMGYYRYPNAQELLRRALDMGVEVVGGIPHFERSMADGTASVTELSGDCGRPRAARRHALRRDRRSDVAPHRDAFQGDPPPRPARAGDGLASGLHARHGQLLRQQADPADRRVRDQRDPQPSHQHRGVGTQQRQLSEVARHDARAGAERGRHHASPSARIA